MEIVNQAVRYLPNNIGNLFPNLKYLTINDSGLEFVERKNFERMEKVTELTMSFNQIQNFSFETFHDLTGIEKISLSNNKLSGVHGDSFINNSKLKYLNFAMNAIEFLPAGLFRRNHELKEIFFDSNKIKRIDTDFRSFRGIRLQFLGNICIDLCFPCDGIGLEDLFHQIQTKCSSPVINRSFYVQTKL